MATRDEHVAHVKSVFVSLATKAAKTSLVASYPILANPILSRITDDILRNILSRTADAGEMGVFFLYIDWRVADQSDAWKKAVDANIAAQLNGTPEEKKNAEANLIDAARIFIKYTT